MKAILSSDALDIPDGVIVKVMDDEMIIEVKGPRGKLSRNFKQLNLNFKLITDEVTGRTNKLKADGSRTDIRTALRHVDNLIKGVTMGYRHKTTRFVPSQLPADVASVTNSLRDRDKGMFTVQHTIGSVLCCKCGIPMQPNAANMCANCLRSEFDITEGERKHVIIIHCPKCDSYLKPPKFWLKAELESRNLLTFCLGMLNGLEKRARLVHAKFIWTEPHSKRIKVQLTIQKEVLSGAILEQSYVVEYVVQDQMCESCTRFQANSDQWVAVVQLRQHVSHKRTFFYLEQLILKHDAAKYAIGIKQMDKGIDFYFNKESHGEKFVNFVGKLIPTRSRRDKQQVSQDTKSNKVCNKHTFSVEISPICREDLICLPPKVAKDLGNLGPLVICTKVSNTIALLDPFTLRQSYLDSAQYWRSSFRSCFSSRQLVEYIVLGVEPVSSEVIVGGSRHVLADAQVARVSDFGKNDTIFNVRTHLGHLLNPGGYALGYDLYGSNSNDIGLDEHKGLILPDVILIKKSYEERRGKKQGRLESLNMEVDDRVGYHQKKMKNTTEYEEFLKDLEEKPDLRFNLSLSSLETDGDEVPLDELLADLDISDYESDVEDRMSD